MYSIDHTADGFGPARAAPPPPADASSESALMTGRPRADERSDNELVAAVCAGDQPAFDLLFERHKRLVTRLAGRFFHRREEVEEIVQESFAEVYSALNTFRGGHEKSFAAWLSRITVIACYQELRRRGRRSESVMSDLSDEDADYLAERLQDERAESAVERRNISRDLISKLLSRLAPEDKLVLILLNVEELSVAEIAELTGWSVSKVKMRAHRARAVLRGVMKRFL